MAARQSPADQLARMQRQHDAEKHLIDKLKMIRSLHMTSYNNTGVEVAQMAVEFYYAIGDILEGQAAPDLNLKVIDKAEFLKEYSDD